MVAVAVRQLAPAPARLSLATAPRVAIRSLGAFSLRRGDEVVPAGEWQSKKARDVLKLLVARRGRPTTREALIEELWPEQDPSRTANRLSVALSTVRAVFDPGRCFARDHFIRADRSAVRLAYEYVDVDVERFLADAQAGLRVYRAGLSEEAGELLEAAESLYTGDFLEEDLYEDWAVALREEARAAYVDVCTALAGLAEEPRTASGYLRRILERDPYEERTHLDLVAALAAAGAQGEARRAFRAYVARMHEIGVEPAPFPLRLSGSPAT